MTRSGPVALMLMAACWSSTPAATPPSNQSAPTELCCKTAIEGASAIVKLRDKDVTMAIGECEQREWSRLVRECVAAVHADADLVACANKYSLGKHGIFADHVTFDAAIKAMERFRDEMCGCKDTACAQQVSDEMSKWSEQMSKELDDPPRMTEEDTKRATAIGETMGKCMQQAMSVP